MRFLLGWIFLWSSAVVFSDPTLQVTLSWEVVSGARGYRIQLSESKQFNALIVDEVVKEAHYLWVTHPKSLPKNGKVYYRLATLDRRSRVGSFSEPLLVPLASFLKKEKALPSASSVAQVNESEFQKQNFKFLFSLGQLFGDDRFLGKKDLRRLSPVSGVYPTSFQSTLSWGKHAWNVYLDSSSWITARSDVEALDIRGFYGWDLGHRYQFSLGAWRLGGGLGLMRTPKWSAPQFLNAQVLPYLGPEVSYVHTFSKGEFLISLNMPLLGWVWKGLGGVGIEAQVPIRVWQRGGHMLQVAPLLKMRVMKSLSGAELLRTQAFIGVLLKYELKPHHPVDTI